MVDDRKIYEEEGLEKYMEYQLTNENVILTPGPAFRFVKVLCGLPCFPIRDSGWQEKDSGRSWELFSPMNITHLCHGH